MSKHGIWKGGFELPNGRDIQRQSALLIDTIRKKPNGLILYFLDNHGEVIFDQLVIEQLLLAGYRVAVVGRGETVRDDVTVDEAQAIFEKNMHFTDFFQNGSLSVITDGSFLLGADLTQSYKYPAFLDSWRDSIAYIAKGAGNFHTLLGQNLSLPQFHIRMFKNSRSTYNRIGRLKGKKIDQRSPYELAFVFYLTTMQSIFRRDFTETAN
ncbi:MAG: ARMT1-like domain-containing protein [Pseudomonadota bacterium]